MAKICADIKPNGIGQKDLVDLVYDIISSIRGICLKLDSDGGVPLTTYNANCVTALFNCVIEDSKGNSLNLAQSESSTIEPTVIVGPLGIGSKDMVQLMYQITNALETLTEQLDTDVLTDNNYEALCYTAIMLHIVENIRGNALGNGTDYYFRPTGVMNQDKLVDWLYNAVNAIETLTEKLDADGTVTDTNYEALWFTATVPLTVENAQGNRVGN